MSRNSTTPALDTLRLSRSARQQILSQMNNASRAAASERRSMRVDFSAQSFVVRLIQPMGSRTPYCVTPRNLSARGVAFIHGQYVHLETTCLVILPRLDGSWVQLEGRVLRCRHVSGVVHEVSVRFNEAIDLAEFVRLSPEQAERWRQESQQGTGPSEASAVRQPPPNRLLGQALVLDSFDSSRALLAHLLQQQGLAVVEVADLEEACKVLAKGETNLVLVELDLSSPEAVETVRELHGSGYVGPIIGLTTDDAEASATQATSQNIGCNAVLGTPIDAQQLYRTTEQLMLFSDSENRPLLHSTLSEDRQMRPLVERFVHQACELAATLRRALAGNDVQTLRTHCRHLKGSGVSFGFQAISNAAALALATMPQADDDLTQAQGTINELITLLERSRV